MRRDPASYPWCGTPNPLIRPVRVIALHQVRVKECEDREAQTQARIASLERELKQLQAARGEIHPATQAEATIIETLLAVDSTLDDEMLG
eukprot:m.369044 g.369044  ORF g.369044 m.369044 type:complete len:90 (+) comp16672_c1_seq25:88-357(+)